MTREVPVGENATTSTLASRFHAKCRRAPLIPGMQDKCVSQALIYQRNSTPPENPKFHFVQVAFLVLLAGLFSGSTRRTLNCSLDPHITPSQKEEYSVCQFLLAFQNKKVKLTGTS